MGAAASMAAPRAAAWEPGINHVQKVTRLYRAALRTSRDWHIDYDMWVKDCERIQARFRANKDKPLMEGKTLVEKGMAELFEMRHPDPYIPIYKPGSSSYQRNVPPPPELTHQSMPPPHEAIQ
ncbi:NADH dehydrogenase [ubiquinone] 1 beta subcomplex subunit 9 [Gracilariopsis chorda]|uniref:NADH dehydrogenase [ubiquinone] 1 beta subcomplex subunit 9 n=1 Tax=Gracilariopsis chorda TaxID=448386 RepID=A0A2V3J8S9_9FLOR|nr:NADH dehydrogenase [ubiquinone] 1 beta subcomplex subunit 9 [Gracilariopsis chorda]|eukprot:PXF50087.1 NADH dehydrogenase [ubiquinone] 1 beta subcomplex subunit 9 [Gracilariopsis chorda]